MIDNLQIIFQKQDKKPIKNGSIFTQEIIFILTFSMLNCL